MWTLIAVVAALVVIALLWRRSRARKHDTSALQAIDDLLAAGDFEAAANVALDALPTRRDPAARLELRVRAARALAAREDFAAAARVCAEATEEAGDDMGLALALGERARCLAASGDFEAATRDLASARALAPAGEVRVAIELTAADCALFLAKLDDAERDLSAAFAAAGRGRLSPEVGLGHARLQLARGNFHQCVAEIGRVLEQLPGDDVQALALVTLARALLGQDHPDAVGADHALSRAALIVHQPGLAAVVTAAQALLHAHFDNVTEALAEARREPATASPRWAAEARCLAGDALRTAGNFLEARSHYQLALAEFPAMPEALFGLGRCAQAFGHFEVAASYFTLCLEGSPGHSLAARAEEALGR